MPTEHHNLSTSHFIRERQQFICPVTGMELVLVKGGVFQMGNVFAETDGDNALHPNRGNDVLPVHEVELDDFYIGKYPVTQAEWVRVMGNNPSGDIIADNLPVNFVSWNDAHEFIRCLNDLSGLVYRLPTEAEWEYSARSGGNNERWAGTSNEEELDEYVWNARYYEDAYPVDKLKTDEKIDFDVEPLIFLTYPVGMLKPNGLGLFDMSGNVWEWCEDWYADWGADWNSLHCKKNPQGPVEGVDRVLRGNCSIDHPMDMQLADRFHAEPDKTCFGPGFRLSFSAIEVADKTICTGEIAGRTDAE